jgi:glucuronoarabinoxylan endo-1,4-beta-xylanase
VYDAQVTILAAENNQVIRGFGCATVFNPPGTSALTTAEFERLFGKGNGQVGLTYLRIRVAADDAWRNTELNYAKEVIKIGGRIIACPWSPPAKFKTNNNLIGGKLITDSSAAYAKYLNDFAVYMETNGAPLYAISVQNEPDWDPSYEGCVWTGADMRDFLKNHGSKITATRLMSADLVNNNQAYVNTIMSDDGAMANLDIFSTHIYGGGIIDNPTMRAKGKEVWMTEHLDTATNHVANLNTAAEIHNCLTKANFSAYIMWYGKRFYGALGQDGIVTKRGYFVSQFARFIQEGATRLGTITNSRSEVLVSAYKNGSKKVVVVVNTGTGQINQKVIIKDATAGTFIPYITSQSKNAEQATQITTSSDNSFTYVIPPLSVVTFVEQ